MAMEYSDAYAIIIGVGGKNFETTVEDAIAIKDVFVDAKKAGYHKENVFLLCNEDATKENILSVFQDVMKRTENNPNSTVIVYFSGHGMEFISSENSSKEYYLVTHGGKIADPKNTMLSGEMFSREISRLKSSKLLVLLDCCYAAAIKDDSVSTRFKTVDQSILKGSSRKLLNSLKKGSGRVFMSSCDDNELSAIIKGSKNSLFTQVVLEALEGASSGNNMYVHVLDILIYAIREVPFRIARYNHIQRPIVNEIVDVNPEYLVSKNSFYREDILEKDNIPMGRPSYNFTEGLNTLRAYQEDFEVSKEDIFSDNHGNVFINNSKIGKLSNIGSITGSTTINL